MPRQGGKDHVGESVGCDLCGAEGVLYQAKVEGTVLTVCDTCKEHGEIVKRLPTSQELKQEAKREQRREAYVQPSLDAAQTRQPAAKGEVLLLVRPDFGGPIKQARERMGLKQEELAKRLRIKESQLTKYETGSKKPDLETARLLEKALQIRLVEQHIEEGSKTTTTDSGPLTIGDMIKRR